MPRSKWQTKAHRRWQPAEWIQGDGPYAVLAHCRVLTVTLHPTLEKAEESKAWIDKFACGGMCVHSHEIVDLND